jgi:hypothetical protein
VGEDLLDDTGVLNARDDAHRPAAGRAGLDVNTEHPFQALRPGHRGAAFGRCRLLGIRGLGMPASPAPLGRCHPRTVFAVGRKHAVEARQVDPRFRHQRCQPGNEVEGLEDNVRGAVTVRRLQLVPDVAVRGERKALFRDGRPAENAYVERYNRTVRHEWLDQHLFDSIEHARETATQWLWHYNNERPNMAIGGVTPKQKLLKAA